MRSRSDSDTSSFLDSRPRGRLHCARKALLCQPQREVQDSSPAVNQEWGRERTGRKLHGETERGGRGEEQR